MKILHLWKRKTEFCILCHKELKHKYKPSKGWNLEGFLCSDCHTQKIKEQILKEQEEIEKQKEEENRCSFCRSKLNSEYKKLKPKWQWNLEKGIILCKNCFEKKDKEFERERNYCSQCGSYLKFIRYNPKPKWNIKGQLCRQCWDERNLIK